MKIFGITFGENEEKLEQKIPIQQDSIDKSTENNCEVLDNTESELGFFKSICNSTSNWTTNTAENISQTFINTKEKTGQAYNNSINFISEKSSSISDSTRKNYVSITEKIGSSYNQIEIKDNLYILLDLISIPLIITGLKKLSVTVPAPQIRIGIVVLIGLLLILENHKINKKNNLLSSEEINKTTNSEVSNLLKDVDLRSIISLVEPFEKQIPMSKQFFFLIKLFIK